MARFLPQSFYYFYAYAQLRKIVGKDNLHNVVVCVPSGNFGNITAGIFAQKMGLPVSRFIAANNRNDIFLQYLKTGEYRPRPSVSTIANAMDVGDPSNFARILDLYQHNHAEICKNIAGVSYSDDEIRAGISECFSANTYLLDPHGACGYLALKEMLKEGETGIFLETAHPIKFKDTVEDVIRQSLEIPDKIKAFMNGKKQTVPMSKDFSDFKSYLMNV